MHSERAHWSLRAVAAWACLDLRRDSTDWPVEGAVPYTETPAPLSPPQLALCNTCSPHVLLCTGRKKKSWILNLWGHFFRSEPLFLRASFTHLKKCPRGGNPPSWTLLTFLFLPLSPRHQCLHRPLLYSGRCEPRWSKGTSPHQETREALHITPLCHSLPYAVSTLNIVP